MVSQPRALVTSSAPMGTSAPAPVSAPQMVQMAATVPVVSSVPVALSSSTDSAASVNIVSPVPVAAIPSAQKSPESVDKKESTTPGVAYTKTETVKVVKPRAKLSPLNPVESEPMKPRPTVKLPVPVRAPVVNLNPMPEPKQKGRKRSSSPGGMVPASPQTPQSSFSENSDFTSSADESGNRISSSVETDASVTENGQRKHRIKKRVSFSDDDKKAKKARRKMRNSKENNELRNSVDGEAPKSILASKSTAEDFKFVGPPNAVRKNTQLNRGRSQSPQRSSQRHSRRVRSQSPKHHRPHPPPPDPNTLHNGPRTHHPQPAPAPAPHQRPRPPLDPHDPAVQSRLRRNSRRRSKEWPKKPQGQPQQGVENLGYVNQAMEMDLSPTHLSPDHNPLASSSPNNSMVNNNNMKAEAVSNWAPIQQSTPPGTPKPTPGVLQLANYSHSSTETEI